jgi:ClpP class serine protease
MAIEQLLLTSNSHPLPLVASDLLQRHLRLDRAQQLVAEPATIKELIARDEAIPLRITGGVAVIPIHGVIEYKMSFWGWLYGGTSCQAIQRALQQAIADPEVTRVIFDVDSPGGIYTGVPETANAIFAARDKLDLVAIANPEAASGSIWLAAAASRFVVIHSGWAGSIGSYNILTSWARMYEEAGIDRETIRDPVGKAEGMLHEPISDALRDDTKQRVQAITAEFHAAMAKFRGVKTSVVKSDFGEGRMLMGPDAVKAGLCDAVSTLEAEVGRGNKRSGGGRMRTELNGRLAMKSRPVTP